MSTQYTDYLGTPVHVGDVITYPICSGSSAADLNLGVVLAIDDLIPNKPGDPKDRSAYLHRDRNKQSPPRREIPGRWKVHARADMRTDLPSGGDFFRDDSKAYMLQIRRVWEGYAGWKLWRPEDALRKVSVKNVDRIVVVTDKIDAATRARAESLFNGILPDDLNAVPVR